MRAIITLHSEAEEETGSAEEHPASNRFPRYAEQAILVRLTDAGFAFCCSDSARWLRKPFRSRLPGIAPASFLRAGLLMNLVWSLHSDASVRTPVVVKVDDSEQFRFTGIYVANLHFVKPFGFQYAVCTFGNRVLKRIAGLSHADCYVILLQLLDIGITAILTTSVGMMDQ